MTEDRKIWHRGGCHCGAVRFSVLLPGTIHVNDCNCSICRMTGHRHLTVRKEELELEEGEDMLTSYRFNTGVANHLFCKVCGVKPFYVPRSHPGGYSVNFRCLDEPEAFDVIDEGTFDGANWEANIAALKERIPD
jgi:hypothetical protein